jgi:perosamine synthetase
MRFKINHSKPTISDTDIKAISKVLKSNYVASGRATKDFQDRFAKLIGVNSAIATNSGTSALHLALLALRVKENDEVVIPSYVCSAVLNAVLYVGARPKIADINPNDFNLNIEDTKKKISQNTKAIILPHMFGKPADIKAFLKLGIPLIENCAHSLGARYKGKPVGCFGDASIFSFYATKMITTGYGGMICSNNKHLIRKMADLINVDERDNYDVRFNYRMSDLMAALGLNQLRKLNSFIAKRREIAKFYDKNLSSSDIKAPLDEEGNHVYFRYVIRINSGIDKVISTLKKKGIEIKKPVFKPLHHYLELDKQGFPNTEAVFNSAVSLPLYPTLKKAEAKFIVESLIKVIY